MDNINQSLEKWLNELNNFSFKEYENLPDLDLYMEQVINYLERQLMIFRTSTLDKQITSSMINNYVKNHLIEAPIKKKYSKIQCAKIFAICILKQVYSMNEICTLIETALKHTDVEHAYDKFCSLFEEALSCAFNNQDFIDKDSNDGNKHLLKSVLLSCSYKIYVQNII